MGADVGVAVVVGLVLAGLWVVHLRRDLRRRQARAADFDGVEGRGDLWTSGAPCPECRAGGALIRREGDSLVHTCMACGHVHVREHKA